LLRSCCLPNPFYYSKSMWSLLSWICHLLYKFVHFILICLLIQPSYILLLILPVAFHRCLHLRPYHPECSRSGLIDFCILIFKFCKLLTLMLALCLDHPVSIWWIVNDLLIPCFLKHGSTWVGLDRMLPLHLRIMISNQHIWLVERILKRCELTMKFFLPQTVGKMLKKRQSVSFGLNIQECLPQSFMFICLVRQEYNNHTSW
jgi:hypothetical protein